jgi:hypothetical protein
MLPTKSELRFAKKGQFDLYTLTNLSFMDIALSMNIHPKLYAVAKENIANRQETVEAFNNIELFS